MAESHNDASLGAQNPVFATTHWSVVTAAQQSDSREAQAALAGLCQTYWFPLYAYARRRGRDATEAQDLVQEFFARVIEKKYFNAADRARGRFRTFLLSSFEHFLAKEWQYANRLKRGGGQIILSLDDETAESLYHNVPADEATPETLFDRQWAFALMERALARLGQEYASTGRGHVFKELGGLLSGDAPEVSYGEIGGRLQMSEGAVKIAAHRLRQRFGEVVRAEIADTVTSPAQLEVELRDLLAALAR